MKITDVNMEGPQKIIAKGEEGTGKGTFGASFPNVYIFDLDGRIKSVARYMKKFGKTDIEYDVFTRFTDVDDMLDKLLKSCPFKTVQFSSLTSLARMLMRQMLEMKGDAKGKKIGGIPVNTVEDYNGETGGIDKVVSKLLRLPCNVILDAHVVRASSYNSGEGPKESRRLLTGGKTIASEIPIWFDEVYHFHVDPSVTSDGASTYYFNTVHIGNDSAKTALPLPAKVDFTGKLAYDIIQEYIAKEKEEEEIEKKVIRL